jgi:hypothetical protein
VGGGVGNNVSGCEGTLVGPFVGTGGGTGSTVGGRKSVRVGEVVPCSFITGVGSDVNEDVGKEVVKMVGNSSPG